MHGIAGVESLALHTTACFLAKLLFHSYASLRLCPCRARVYQYYLPIYLWLRHQLQEHQKTHPESPLFLGLSAPQGSGKTTICEELQHLLTHEGYQAVFASLDDFYLSFDDQQALAKVCTSVTYATNSTMGTSNTMLVICVNVSCFSYEEHAVMYDCLSQSLRYTPSSGVNDSLLTCRLMLKTSY